MAIDSKPNFQKIEGEIISFWENGDFFKFDNTSGKPIYSIDTPPPTISGNLHIGHAFSYSQTEFIARYKRMKGFNVFYPFGFDNNGLATEKMTERIKKVRPHTMERKEFVKLCLEVSKQAEKEYEDLWRRIGISCDWSLVYRTISPEIQKISQTSFVRLFKDKRIYRKEAPTIWSPLARTAIAQVELEDKEMDSEFINLDFELTDGGTVEIATTRPELLCACRMLFVHPDDKEKAHLVGKKVKVPVYEHIVEIKTDKRVDPKKGTGVVMFCTFGDLTDVDWFNAYEPKPIIAINPDGKMNEKSGPLEGLKVEDARKKIKEILDEKKLIKSRKQIKHSVNVHERTGKPVEFLLTKQWFISYLDLKDEFLKAGNEIKWYPEHMKTRYDNWINGLQWDWCISRQRYFGIAFPLWYCEKCKEIILAKEENLPVDPLKDTPKEKCKCGSDKFIAEKDILDTWTTSSLTPLINAKWPEDEEFVKKLYPMSLRANAHDIITFWDFNTIVMGLFHMKKIPFENIMISGHGLDKHGKKMSKSKGNVVLPLEVIQKHSADSLRYWAASVKLGEDLNYREEDVMNGKKFSIKLWNAARFISMHFENEVKEPTKIHITDRWLLKNLDNVIKIATESFENYEYSKAKRETEYFFWNYFTDFYLEMIKYRLFDDVNKESAVYTLKIAFRKILLLFAPFTPFVTDKLYQELFSKNKETLHLQEWPVKEDLEFSEEEEKEMNAVIDSIKTIRKLKKDENFSLGAEIEKIKLNSPIEIKNKDALETLQRTMRVKKIEFENSEEFSAELVK